MKKYFICTVLLTLCFGQYSCKEFLSVDPIDKLTGNNFYKSKDDLDQALNGMYRILYNKYTETNTASAIGEFRAGDVIPQQLDTYRESADNIGGRLREGGVTKKDPKAGILKSLYETSINWVRDYKYFTLTRWNEYYTVIQGANIMVQKLEDGVPGITEAERNRYEGEAKFLRNYCYYFMVTLYGDVAYYTDAYQKDPLPREDFVSVLNKCIADLNTVKDRAPWNLPDPSLRGVRASRGSITVLLMHMNMWNAGFDGANSTKYYEATAKLGEEIIQSKAHRLLPLSDWNLVIKGRSEESLFELFQSINYGEQPNPYAPFGDGFLHYPYKQPRYNHLYSFNVFTGKHINMLYPDEATDGREEEWFDELDVLRNFTGDETFTAATEYQQPHFKFQLSKFAQNVFIGAKDPSEDKNPDNTFMIYRYADAILLHAEALAELGGRDNDAISSLNMVRDRANATLYTGTGGQGLKDAIFIERAKELMGEGHRYFDLVRTKRILNIEWTDNPLSADQFLRGGWTWPINASALTNNPYMSLNTYWF